MSETQTFEFESARVLGALFLNDLQNIRVIEETLGVKITTREGWLRVEYTGGKAPVARTLGLEEFDFGVYQGWAPKDAVENLTEHRV